MTARESRPRNVSPCSVDGCNNQQRARGLCPAHWRRWRTYGHPTGGIRPYWSRDVSLIERLLRRIEIDPESSCWRFTGAQTNGYGRIGMGGPKVGDAHRVAYEYWVGPIPPGLHLDHVFDRGCRYRDCCNPDHLEPVTQAENNRRAHAVKRSQQGKVA